MLRGNNAFHLTNGFRAFLRVFFAGQQDNVYSSHDLGNSWMIASDGLPIVAQGTDLHAITQPDGTLYLYLATYGWSLWRAALP